VRLALYNPFKKIHTRSRSSCEASFSFCPLAIVIYPFAFSHELSVIHHHLVPFTHLRPTQVRLENFLFEFLAGQKKKLPLMLN
jgi:hypothetical protein